MVKYVILRRSTIQRAGDEEPADNTSRLFLCPDLRGYAILICGCLTPCGALMRPQPFGGVEQREVDSRF